MCVCLEFWGSIATINLLASQNLSLFGCVEWRTEKQRESVSGSKHTGQKGDVLLFHNWYLRGGSIFYVCVCVNWGVVVMSVKGVWLCGTCVC